MPPGTGPNVVNSDQGFSQLTAVMARHVPRRLLAAKRSNQALTNLTKRGKR